VLLAQAECLCTLGGRNNGKPTPFKRPLQKISEVVVVLDQQDADRRLPNWREVKSGMP
jgi:hypothetical protein